MGVAQLELSGNFGLIFSGKAYDSNNDEAGFLINIDTTNSAIFYMKRPALQLVSSFAI